MKYLLACLLMLLAVACLWPEQGAAQVSTSKTLNITVTAPAGVCSQPPPAPAAAAGFTTLALCSDWTTQMPVNWLGGCAVAGNGSQTNQFDTTGHAWYNNIWWSNTNQACTTKQNADPAFGNLALDMPWISNSTNQQIGMTLQSAAWFSTDITDANQGITMPNNFYMEAVARQTPIAQGSFFAFWTWPVLAMTQGSTGQAGNELDSVELDSGNLNNSDSAYHNWLLNNFGPWVWQGICGHGAVPQGLPCNFDPTQYHTFSSIMQSDGVINNVCSYVDGALLMCQPSPGGFTPVQAVARYFILLQNACDWWNYASNFCNAGLNQHTYVKSVKLWSCPTWQTTQCNKSSGSGGPNGTNQLSSIWVNSNGTQTVTTAPDGKTPALKITQDSSAVLNHGVTQTGAYPTTTSTFGLNIAPGTGSGATSVQMLVCDGASLSPCSDGVGAFFNPTNGTLIRTATGGANDHFLGAGTTAIAGGGFHVWFTYSMPASAQVTALVATGAQANGDGTSSTLIWNWALETGSNEPTDGIGPGFFVATTGNDSNPGTQASPFLTLGKCQTAMQGSTTKVCYIRAGTYQPAKITNSTDGVCNHHYSNGVVAGTAVALTAPDAGETWSYYPPDGFGTAIIDGQSTAGESSDQEHGSIAGGPANGLGCIFSAVGVNNITINGLQLERFVWSGFIGNQANNATFTNNTVHDTTGVVFGSGAAQIVDGMNFTGSHNYFHDLAYVAFNLAHGAVSGGISGATYDSNVAINTCTFPAPQGNLGNDQNGGDCGPLYMVEQNFPETATNIHITNNYVRDVNAAQNATNSQGSVGIYLDDSVSNAVVSGNVVAGKMTTCFLVHGGAHNTIKDNICDIDNGAGTINTSTYSWLSYLSGSSASTGMTGNTLSNNIFVMDNAGAGGGHRTCCGFTTPMAISNNFYHNYVGSTPITTGDGGAGTSDTNPVFGDPQISCWSPVIAQGSPVFSAPNTGVSFPGITGGWGPPGFVMPQTGTPPSWPHAC